MSEKKFEDLLSGLFDQHKKIEPIISILNNPFLGTIISAVMEGMGDKKEKKENTDTKEDTETKYRKTDVPTSEGKSIDHLLGYKHNRKEFHKDNICDDFEDFGRGIIVMPIKHGDISEQHIMIYFSLPGTTKEEIKIGVKNKMLCVYDKNFNFNYQVNLTDQVDPQTKYDKLDLQKITSVYNNGRLEVRIPFIIKPDEVINIEIN